MIEKLRFKAVPGSLLGDPLAPGSYLGRKSLPMPPDGWPVGTKPEERFPIIEEGATTARTDNARWRVVLDALQKGVDLVPGDEATAKRVGRKVPPAPVMPRVPALTSAVSPPVDAPPVAVPEGLASADLAKPAGKSRKEP